MSKGPDAGKVKHLGRMKKYPEFPVRDGHQNQVKTLLKSLSDKHLLTAYAILFK